MWKRISWPVWLLMVWPYSLFALIGVMFRLSVRAAMICLGAWVLLTLIVCGLNLWNACRDGKHAPLRGMAVKLALIPFYAGVFALGVITFAAPPAIVGLFLLDGLLLLTTSAYGLAAAFRALWERRLTMLPGLLLAAGHLLFAVDVACSVILWAMLRRQPE